METYRNNQSATTRSSLEDIYASYRRFLQQFHEASGPRREPMTLDEFCKWWPELRESDRANYLAFFKTGYKELDENSPEVDAMQRRMRMAAHSG